jgi:hypothetical protein
VGISETKERKRDGPMDKRKVRRTGQKEKNTNGKIIE